MDAITRNVRDIDQADRDALEHVIGQSLREDQQVVISVVRIASSSPSRSNEASGVPAEEHVPEWWNVCAGLSDREIDCLDQAIRETGRPHGPGELAHPAPRVPRSDSPSALFPCIFCRLLTNPVLRHEVNRVASLDEHATWREN
jgi:hypothetical protein